MLKSPNKKRWPQKQNLPKKKNKQNLPKNIQLRIYCALTKTPVQKGPSSLRLKGTFPHDVHYPKVWDSQRIFGVKKVTEIKKEFYARMEETKGSGGETFHQGNFG